MMDLAEIKKQLASLEKDDILKLFGVEERRTAVDHILPAVGLFSVGVLVGAGLGLLLAPKPGYELREDLRSRIGAGNASATPGAESSRVGESTRPM